MPGVLSCCTRPGKSSESDLAAGDEAAAGATVGKPSSGQHDDPAAADSMTETDRSHRQLVNNLRLESHESHLRAKDALDRAWQGFGEGGSLTIEDVVKRIGGLGVNLPLKDDVSLTSGTKVDSENGHSIVKRHLKNIKQYKHTFNQINEELPIKNSFINTEEERAIKKDLEQLEYFLSNLHGIVQQGGAAAVAGDAAEAALRVDSESLRGASRSEHAFVYIYFLHYYVSYAAHLRDVYQHLYDQY